MGKDGNGPKHSPQPNQTPPQPRQYTDERVFSNTSGHISYDDIPGDELSHFVKRVTDAGGCVIFGITSDGGAYSLTVIIGRKRWREWPNSAERMLQAMSIVSDQL